MESYQTLRTVDADTLMALPIKRAPFIVDGLISQGVTLMCGSSKVGKSWMMLRLGMQVTQGLPMLGMKTYKCDVLYLCLEDTFARIQDRLYKMTDEAPENLRLAVKCASLGDGFEEQIEKHLAGYPETKLIIIDTFQKARGVGANTPAKGMYADDYREISGFKTLADSCYLAIVLVHHLRKIAGQSRSV